MRTTFSGRLAIASGLATLSLAACSDQAAPTGPQGTLNVDIAPLSLPGILDADYGIVVKNRAGEIVWQESSLTSTQYGDSAGSLTYIGTCDASLPGLGPAMVFPRATNTVYLTLNSLSDASGIIDPSTYVNPCPEGTPCTAEANCVENEDAAITFNLAIMRDASQGFFDIAVNFQDVFCSAKVDCQEALLFDGVSRVPTAVIGFACTSGKDSAGATESTTLHTDFQADWGSGPGHLDTTSPGNKSDLAEPYAVYKDSEELAGYTKGFVNAAVAVAGGVHITGQATASTGTLPAPSSGSTFTSYPVVQFDVDVPASCEGWTGAVELNAGQGVDTSYLADPSDAAYDKTDIVPPGGTIDNGGGGGGGGGAWSGSASCVAGGTCKAFVMDQLTGEINGPTGADGWCSDVAWSIAGITENQTKYKAVLVDGSTRVACTTDNCSGGLAEHVNWVLSPNTKYVRPDGTVIGFTNALGVGLSDHLGAAGLDAAFGGTGLAWTGLTSTWTTAANTCSGWTSLSGSGQVGDVTSLSSTAWSSGTDSCGNRNAYYCVETP